MRIWFLALFSIFNAVVLAQWSSSLDSLTQKAFEAFEQNGAVVGVWQNGEFVYQKAMGYKNAQLQEELNINTVFQVASVSKAFTAASVGILVDKGLLGWDDKVIDHLPHFKLYDPYVTRNFLVKDLLCHRNGYNTFDGDLLWYETDYTSEEILERFSKLAPKHGFREKYGYSNIMFVVAALLIEEKSGKTWEQFIADEIFSPLGMNSSFTDFDAFLAHQNIATPHIEKKPDLHRNYNSAKGAVGVKTNVPDLAKWAQMWMQNGLVNGDTLIHPNTVNFILNAHTANQVSLGNKKMGKYHSAAGLGWFVEDYAGIDVYRHSGGLPGLILNLCIVPEKNTAIIVLTNDETYFPFAFTNEVLDDLAGVDLANYIDVYVPYSNKNIIKNRIEVKQSWNKKPWLSNDELLGEYQDEYYGNAKVYAWKGGLKLHLTPTASFVSDLVWIEGLSYRIRFKDKFLPDGKVVFEMNSNNEVEGFKIDLPNPDFHFYNLDFKKK